MVEFLNLEHQSRVLVALVQLQYVPLRTAPSDWTACLYVLSANPDIWRRMAKHLDLSGRQIHFDESLNIPFSTGERFLVDLAQLLFNGEGEPDWDAYWDTLDNRHATAALNGLRIRREGAGSIRWQLTDAPGEGGSQS